MRWEGSSERTYGKKLFPVDLNKRRRINTGHKKRWKRNKRNRENKTIKAIKLDEAIEHHVVILKKDCLRMIKEIYWKKSQRKFQDIERYAAGGKPVYPFYFALEHNYLILSLNIYLIIIYVLHNACLFRVVLQFFTAMP